MYRHVVDDLYQIGELVTSTHGVEVVSLYVLLNGDRPILIDCGSQLHRAPIMADLDAVLGGREPAYLFMTHSELPHAGNIAAVAQRWPAIHGIVSNVMLPYIEVLPVLPLAQITQVAAGTTLTLAGRALTFVDALLKDQPGSQWIYDPQTQTLFTGDGFGYHAAPGAGADLLQFSDERPDGVTQAQFETYHRRAFHFLRWIDPVRFNADLDRLFTRRRVAVIAPIHGAAIRGDIPLHVERLKAALAAVSAGYGRGHGRPRTGAGEAGV